VLLGFWAFGGPAGADPSIHLVEREEITLTVRPLTAQVAEGQPSSLTFDAEGGSSAELELELRWPDADSPRRLRLRATPRPALTGPVARITSELIEQDGSVSARASREMLFTTDSTTALFEVARHGDHVLTLVVAGERTRRMEYSVLPVIGKPVAFTVEIEWVKEGRGTLLETNLLQTFVGQSVGYSFRLGAPGMAQAASLRLLPLQLVGDTMRVEVDLSGTVTDEDGDVTVISRKEQWLSTRGTTSTLSLADGEPPTGFRFLVTPRF
jgi:hypothetical protein